jgi:hypothetical protein
MSFPGARPRGIIRADTDYFKLKIYGREALPGIDLLPVDIDGHPLGPQNRMESEARDF